MRIRRYNLKESLSAIFLALILASFFINTAEAEDEFVSSQSGLFVPPDAISSQGTTTSAIPIHVPSGRNGMAPGLSINYNSTRNNGILGVGWNLDMGSIQRSTKWGVSYTGNDYVVNGSAELVQRGEWGGNYYGAKIEGAYTKYQLLGNAAGWIATTKGGTKYYYGRTNSSRQYNPLNSSEVFKWCLDKVVDTNGNYMEVHYTKTPNGSSNQGQIYLDSISYTGNESGLSPINWIGFFYEERTDDPSSYALSFEVKMTHRLKTIEVRSNSSFIGKYELTYDNPTDGLSTGRSLLASVTRYGSDGVSSLPENTFEYYQVEAGFNGGTSTTGDNDWISEELKGFADFNGDGKQDFWYVPSETGGLMVRLSDGQTLGDAAGWLANWYHSSGFADFNGDGKQDVWFYDSYPAPEKLMVRLSNGSGFDPATEWANGDWGASRGLEDFNGDGKQDFYFVEEYSIGELKDIEYFAKIMVRLSNGSGLDTATEWLDSNCSNFTCRASRKLRGFADFNGDGKQDLWHSSMPYPSYGELMVRLSNGSGFDETATEWANVVTSSMLFTDINGDGKQDIPSVRTVRLSNGSSFEPEIVWINNPEEGNLKTQLADFNGDGIEDLWYISTDHSNVMVRLGNGSGLDPATAWANGNWQDIELGFADISGDGKKDFWYIPSGTTEVKVMRANIDPPDLLRKTTSSLGGTSEISYTCSTEYDNTSLPFNIYVISSISSNPGLGGQSITIDYSYSGGFYDHENRDFRGFNTVLKTYPNNTTQKTYYNVTDEYLKGRTTLLEVKDSADLTVSETEFEWWPANYIENSESKAVQLFRKFTEVYENGEFAYRTYTYYDYYNEHGSVNSVLITNGDGEGSLSFMYYDYFSSEGTSYPLRMTKEILKNSSNEHVRQTEYGYETGTGTGNLLCKVFYNNDGPNPRINYEYTTYGNLWKTWDANGNPPTVIEYDALTHTYPVKVTDPVGHDIEHEYDDTFIDKLTTTRDYNGNPTNYTYDAFGRLVQVDYPDGGQSKTNYTYFDNESVSPRYIITSVKEYAEQFQEKYDYFDGLGRKIQAISFGENGKPVVIKMHYDNMGRNHLVEGPFFGAGTGYPQSLPTEGCPSARTVYDDRGRPVEVRKPIDPSIIDTNDTEIVVTYEYQGLSTTVSDLDEGKKTEIKDCFGRLVEVIEYASDSQLFHTTYKYNAAGNLLEIEDHLGNITTMIYDKLGRKRSMDDPDKGYWTYTYDENGNLETQTDAKADPQTITLNYDALNRIVSKTYSTSEPGVTYQYDQAENGIGKLYSVAKDSTITTYNSYDPIGRIKLLTETIGSKNYSTYNEYDLSGKTISVTYPDPDNSNYLGESVYYEYYPGSGLLSEVNAIGTDYYAKFEEYEPSGKMGQVYYGNNTSKVYTYDPVSTRLYGYHSISYYNQIETTLQERTYEYSPAGNIKSISDTLSGVTYNYEYDKLHRLVKESNTYTTTISKAYELSYSFHGGPVHAAATPYLNGSASYDYIYDGNGNLTSGPDFTDPDQVAMRTIAYNPDNMPISIEYSKGAETVTTEFEYDGGGSRVKKIQGGNTTYYIGNHYEEINGVATKYIFAGNTRVAMIKDGDIYYFHKDHLGSTNIITDADGVTVGSATEYLPFGLERSNSGQNITDYKFTDQEFDDSTNLYNYDARLYDPAMGMFISADSIIPDYSDPQSFNRYAYCRNNPLIYVDPDGKIWLNVLNHGGGAAFAAIEHYNKFKRGSISGIEYAGLIALGGVSGLVSSGTLFSRALSLASASLDFYYSYRDSQSEPEEEKEPRPPLPEPPPPVQDPPPSDPSGPAPSPENTGTGYTPYGDSTGSMSASENGGGSSNIASNSRGRSGGGIMDGYRWVRPRSAHYALAVELMQRAHPGVNANINNIGGFYGTYNLDQAVVDELNWRSFSQPALRINYSLAAWEHVSAERTRRYLEGDYPSCLNTGSSTNGTTSSNYWANHNDRMDNIFQNAGLQ